MIVANHVSWLDIYALNAARPARFVAKSEVLGWPVIGLLAHCAGTLFIERTQRRDIRRVNAQIAELLLNGETIAFFPEGTTSGGDRVLPFRASLLQPAVECDAHLQAVAISYLRADGSLCSEADYTGDKSLFTALRLVLTQSLIHARVQYLPTVRCGARHRRDLAQEAESRVAYALGLGPVNTQVRSG